MDENYGNKIWQKKYTIEEVTLCAYAAQYDVEDIGGISEIRNITSRSLDSIKMKIQNITALLDYKGVRRHSKESPLTGLPQGQKGRLTDWDLVEKLSSLPKATFLKRRRDILER